VAGVQGPSKDALAGAIEFRHTSLRQFAGFSVPGYRFEIVISFSQPTDLSSTLSPLRDRPRLPPAFLPRNPSSIDPSAMSDTDHLLHRFQ